MTLSTFIACLQLFVHRHKFFLHLHSMSINSGLLWAAPHHYIFFVNCFSAVTLFCSVPDSHFRRGNRSFLLIIHVIILRGLKRLKPAIFPRQINGENYFWARTEASLKPATIFALFFYQVTSNGRLINVFRITKSWEF